MGIVLILFQATSYILQYSSTCVPLDHISLLASLCCEVHILLPTFARFVSFYLHSFSIQIILPFFKFCFVLQYAHDVFSFHLQVFNEFPQGDFLDSTRMVLFLSLLEAVHHWA